MIRILRQIFHTGIVTEPLPKEISAEIEQVGAQLEETVRRRFRGSLAIRQVDAGSCNGCELEIHAINNPIYNCERFGIHFTASPRFADMLLVTGPVTRNMEKRSAGLTMQRLHQSWWLLLVIADITAEYSAKVTHLWAA